MTPFGHIGGGLLIAGVAEKIIAKGQFSLTTLGIALFLSLLPDLDGIPAFLFRKWRPGNKRLDHHNCVSQPPLFYLFFSIIVWISIGKELSILFLLLTLTHLQMDSWGTDDGIMWFWPISKQKFSFFPFKNNIWLTIQPIHTNNRQADKNRCW